MGNKRSQPMSWGTWYCFLCTLTVNVVLATNTSCPTWHYYNNATGQCECGAGLLCSSDGNQVEIENGLCATSSRQEGDYYIGSCPFRGNINSTNRLYSEMPSNASQLDEVMCGPYSRRGLLCGECKEGYGPAVYSLDLKCAKCSSTWSGYAISLYLFLQFIPTTLIFISLVVFRINIVMGPLLGYVLFCQITLGELNYRYFLYDYIKSNVSLFLRGLFFFSVTVSQFWSLQYFKAIIPPFCISENLTGIHIHLLNFIPVIYPLIVVIISCVLMELHARNYRMVRLLWKPFKIILSKAKLTEVTSDAVFHAFASFIFLSNTSVLLTTCQVLGAINVHNSFGMFKEKVLYIDPTVEVFSHNYTPYAIIALILFISISVIPSVLLCIYPTRVYRYLSRFLSARKRLAITAFAEALHSCFKDGLNGTRDYRGLAGAPLLFLFLINLALRYILQFFVNSRTRKFEEQVIWMILVCVVSYLKPCKSTIANISLVFHMTLFGIVLCARYLWVYELSVGTYTLELIFIACLLAPHILVALWAGYTLIKHTLTRFGYQFHGPGCKVALSDIANGVRLCLCRRHRDYQEMDEQ